MRQSFSQLEFHNMKTMHTTLPSFRFVTLTGLLGLLGLGLPPSEAEDWPRWGGNDPGRNMYSRAKGLPSEFDPGKPKPGSEEIDLKTTRNVKWVAKLGSQSYGNAVVAGGRVYIGTNNENPRDPQHTGDRSILLCFDEKTGDFLWQLVVPKLASGKVNDWENLGLLSSPCVEDHRVYLVTSRCEVLCLDTEGQANGNDGPFKDEDQYVVGPGKPKAKIGPKDADIIWRYDMMDELGVFPHNASNCSVLILDDLVYVCTSNGQDWTHVNIPSPNSPSFIALDKKTGKLAAEDNAGIGPRIFHGEWTSPSAGKINGRWQVCAQISGSGRPERSQRVPRVLEEPHLHRHRPGPRTWRGRRPTRLPERNPDRRHLAQRGHLGLQSHSSQHLDRVDRSGHQPALRR